MVVGFGVGVGIGIVRRGISCIGCGVGGSDIGLMVVVVLLMVSVVVVVVVVILLLLMVLVVVVLMVLLLLVVVMRGVIRLGERRGWHSTGNEDTTVKEC